LQLREEAQAGGALGRANADGADANAAGAVAGFGAGALPAAPGAAAQPALPAGEAATPSLVIRTGSAMVEVDSLEPALAAVRLLAARWGGWVANAAISSGKEQTRSASLEIKVPAARFDSLVGALSPLGRVEAVNVSAQDVGEEFVDVTARVANARRLETRLVDLLERRTARLSDMLTVERELARVREEIERYEGRLRYLRTRIAVSTLTVTVHEPPPLVASAPGEHPIADAVRQAGRNFVGVVAALIASTGVLIPVGVVAALVWVGVRRGRRGRKPAREEPAVA
jgi:hypothetical protein